MNQFISLKQAIAMTSLYRKEKENILAKQFQDQNILPNCETFDRAVFDSLLAKPDCSAIRVYYGMDESLKVHAILVPVDSKNEDILPGPSAEVKYEYGDIGEEGRRCPDDCPSSSPLNP
jgi:hypothetical protein